MVMISDGSGSSASLSWAFRLREIFWPPAPPRPAEGEEPEIIPPERRKAAMTSINGQEVRWSFLALVLATIAGVAIPAYIIATNKVSKHGKNSIAVAPDAWLLGGAILLFCVIGYVLIWRRRRSLLAFDLFLIGFGFTLFIGLIGFLFILVGGWLLLHAWRINKYGTYNAKVIARETRNRPRGGASKGTPAKSTAKSRATYDPDAPKKPPAASKRYTPKAPPRKKVPKPTQ
ncbi:MAG TPA: tetraspanin family protein [Acidimicrobiales bacterium]|jgi:hypothetical protein|nr:tetraspanin family protein [Acidimicrobiales bacterium]